MAKKYLIETFGCQMNVHDSERMAGMLDRAGYERAHDEQDADVIVINTCSVREHAAEKLYTRLGEIRVIAEQTGRKPIVTVAGCVAQQEGSALLKATNGHVIDAVVGTQRLKMLPMLVEAAQQRVAPSVAIESTGEADFPVGVARRQDPVKAYVTIIEGCNDYCTFCVVPYTRGHERMRDSRVILADVEEAVATGHREVHLLGQIVNHYVAPDDPSCDFTALLERVNEVRGLERIRFASPHPRHTGTRLFEAMRDLPKVCKHLHLPVQSGSSRVLAAMRRRYSRDSYLRLIDEVRETLPNIALSTDMIVGFPGETATDFGDTLSLVEQVGFHSMFSFKYSERPNTLASKRLPDNVPDGEKSRRIVELQAFQREIQTRIHESYVGQSVEVLVDSASRRRGEEMCGRTSGNTIVNFPVGESAGSRGRLGTLATVSIRRAGPHSLWGELDAKEQASDHAD